MCVDIAVGAAAAATATVKVKTQMFAAGKPNYGHLSAFFAKSNSRSVRDLSVLRRFFDAWPVIVKTRIFG